MSSPSTIQPNETSTTLVQLLSSTAVDSQAPNPSQSTPVKNDYPIGLSLWPLWFIMALITFIIVMKPIVCHYSDKHEEWKAERERAAAQAYIDEQRQKTLVYEKYP
jgi:hypothetical protein